MTTDSKIEWGHWASGRPVGPISQTENINGRIRHRIPKPADRPRASHKLDLQGGDVVELMGWQDGGNFAVGTAYTFIAGKLVGDQCAGDVWDYSKNAKGNFRKGHRPLFCVISRAADAKQEPDNPPARRQQLVAQGGGFYRTMTEAQTRAQVAADATPDEVFTIHKRDKAYVLTFPHGSNTGTVVKEAL